MDARSPELEQFRLAGGAWHESVTTNLPDKWYMARCGTSLERRLVEFRKSREPVECRRCVETRQADLARGRNAGPTRTNTAARPAPAEPAGRPRRPEPPRETDGPSDGMLF